MKRLTQSAVAALFLTVLSVWPARAAEHVVLVVCDGLRPDFVTQERMPNLWRLAQDGVFFERHHPVYLSATAVNCAALATGTYPHKNGFIANVDYYPALDASIPLNVDAAGAAEIAQRGDAVTKGHFLRMPTIAEILHDAGLTTAICGAKDVTVWQDRAIARPNEAARKSWGVFAGKSVLPETIQRVEEKLGKFPMRQDPPYAAPNEWTRRALTEVFWADGLPALSILWLNDPDATQHKKGLGSPEAWDALKMADDNLAAVLNKLDELGMREKTDVMVVSDHGFSTVHESVDLLGQLRGAGFRIGRQFEKNPQAGDVLVLAQGGTELFYVAGRDAATIQRLVEFLQQKPFIGAIFTPKKMAGTLPMAAVQLDREPMPDVVISFRWSAGKNAAGVPGIFTADGLSKGPYGTHASLSAFDMHNTLVASGPDFKRGFRDVTPSGNADVAPTILTLLGQPVPKAMEGRVLVESLRKSEAKAPESSTETLRAERAVGAGVWRQYLQISRVGAALYLDEANGGWSPSAEH